MSKQLEKDVDTVGKIKDYLTRLGSGESLESVRADFVEEFESVDATEIAQAEQKLIQAGTPISEVQKLCDVHSALFHGKTKEEQLDRGAQAIADALNKHLDSLESEEEASGEQGHPVKIFVAENQLYAEIISDLKSSIESDAPFKELHEKLKELRSVANHYAKKGDLIYPVLDRTYGVSGPSNVMWDVDDEIRDEMRLLERKGEVLDDFKQRLKDVVIRAEEMIYKENNILFPMCLKKFSEIEWMRIYYELPAYETILSAGYPTWRKAEERRDELKTVGGKIAIESDASEGNQNLDGYVTLGSGMMTLKQIESVLNTIPMELTFVDDKNINRYFDKGEKLFKRPDMAIGRDVSSCHPPKVSEMANRIIESFRSGEKDKVEVWLEKNNKPVFVVYCAVRDEDGAYLGVLECVQDMSFAERHFAAAKSE